MRWSLYNKTTKSFEKRELRTMGNSIGYDNRTCEYILHNDKEVFARIGCEYISQWCKDMGLEEWYIGSSMNTESETIRPEYVVLFFANMIFGQLDLNQMTDAHVVRKCLEKYV